MSAAKWHREQATGLNALAERTARDGNRVDACEWRDVAAHHALAAGALEALAVEGVADLIEDVLRRGWVGRLDMSDADAARLKDQQRAALATLAKIGRRE